MTANGYMASLWSDENVLKLESGYGCTILRIYLKLLNCILKE